MTTGGAVMRVALAGAIVSACVKIPEFQPRDSAVGDGNGDATVDGSISEQTGATAVLVQSLDQIHVTYPGLYQMRFSSEAYHFPYNWGIGAGMPMTQAQVLYTADPQSCTLEKDMGTAMFPAHIFSSTVPTGVVPTTAVDTIEVAGPPIAKVRLGWGYNVGGACTSTPQGTSTFTFLPDGRVVRMDVARMPAAASGNDCDCAGDSSWFVTTFATFSRGVVQDVQGISSLPSPTSSTSLMQSDPYQRTPCLRGPSFSIGIGWRNANGGSRMRAVDGTGLAFVGDMIASTQTIGGGGNNGLVGDTTTTYWPALGDQCDALRADILAMTTDPPSIELVTTSETVPMGLAQDGIYGGETAVAPAGRGVGAPAVTVRPATVSVGAFALWLEFGSYARSTAPIVTRLSGTPATPWFSLQRPTTTQYLFWFPDGLAAADEIAISTQ